MKHIKKFLICFSFLGLLFSCQNNELFNDTNIAQKKQINKIKKPTVTDALNFINSNLLKSNVYAARGINDYQLKIDTTYTIPYENKPFLKLVCFKPKGYALVSDIDNVSNPPVLFYDKNKFDKKNVNPALVEYIQEFLLIHSSLERAPTPNEDKDGDGAWDNGKDTNTGDPRDSPYYYKETVLKVWTENFVKGPLMTSQWNQEKPFNNKCKTKNGKKAKAGCVAIAIGQIMNYHRKNTNKNYDWNKINNLVENEVAEFISDIGKGVKMNYGTERSGASDYNALIYFKKSGYPNTILTGYNYGFFKYLINNNIPVYLSAYSGRRRYKFIGIDLPFDWKYIKGHAWVADGYKTVLKKKRIKVDEGNKGGGISYVIRTKSINYIHMNWGWGNYYQYGGGGWCTYDYFKASRGSSNYKYEKKMMIPLQ